MGFSPGFNVSIFVLLLTPNMMSKVPWQVVSLVSAGDYITVNPFDVNGLCLELQAAILVPGLLVFHV